MQDQPMLAPPPGIVPNLANPESRAAEIYVAASICLPLIVIFAAMRFYAKVAILKKWTWDDVTCTLGVLAGLVYISLHIAAANGGVYGKHLWEITFKEFTGNQLLLALVVESIYGPFVWFVKLSLFVLYAQLFRPLQWLRYLACAGAVTTGMIYVAIMIAFLVLCAPTDGHSQHAYLSALDSPRCTQTRSLTIVLGIVSVISDLYLVILPLPAAWNLQLPLRKKLAVSAMFFTGSVACIASAFALAYRVQITKNRDVTWIFVRLSIMTNVELTAGIIVCCMPTTTAVLKRFKPPITSIISSYKKYLLLSATDRGAMKHHELGSVTNFRPTHRDQSYESSSEVANDLRDPFTNVENRRSEWPSKYEKGSTFAFTDARTHEMTDIKVIRHP